MKDISILYRDYKIYYKETMNYWYMMYPDRLDYSTCYKNCSLKGIKRIIDKIIIKEIDEKTKTDKDIYITYDDIPIRYDEFDELWRYNNGFNSISFRSLSECKNDIKNNNISFILITNKQNIYNCKDIINYKKLKIVKFLDKDINSIRQFSYDFLKENDIIFIKETMPGKEQTILSLKEFNDYLQTEAKQGE